MVKTILEMGFHHGSLSTNKDNIIRLGEAESKSQLPTPHSSKQALTPSRQPATMMLPPSSRTLSTKPNLLRRSGIVVPDERWVLLSSTIACVCQSRKLPLYQRRLIGTCCSSYSSSSSSGEIGYAEKKDEIEGYYLASEFGWGVRRMFQVGEEMRSVAYVQAEAFHVPVFLFDDFFFQFFQAEVLSALIYKIRNSEADRYACLVAEPLDACNLASTSVQGHIGVVDIMVQRDADVLRQVQGAEEYLYVSGIAVLKDYRRRKVGRVLLKACDALSKQWGFKHLALRAYEDDIAARKLYDNSGYQVVSTDPNWMAWIGKRRRVLMIKSLL